jgi:phosphoribosyl-ATP pyrophosphohydrolase/phosphoribosyl-AMP cyclohydrolase/histidinol dehydrogenase
MSPLLRRLSAAEVPALRRDAVSAATLAEAAPIVEAVRAEGEAALRRFAHRFGELPTPEAPLLLPRAALADDWHALPAESQATLARAAARITAFAAAQVAALGPVRVPVPGGEAALRYAPVARAGCYAPGGRFPLPSSVLMTVATARAAGVPEVLCASPRPTRETRAAAYIAGADALLVTGGAHTIAAFAFGAGPIAPVDTIVGPGNRWVTAAKQLVAGRVGIDMLAGPSELVVLADASADPSRVAADLLAQAEHDPDALPILLSTDPALLDAVDAALAAQLATLPTRDTAAAACANGFAVAVADLDEGIALCDRLAPEHLALHLPPAACATAAAALRHYGALFIGDGAAEVLGDYAAGPNHTLPTGGTARSAGALSAATFLRVQTTLRIDDLAAAAGLVDDAVRLARMEGLEAHARAAEARRVTGASST